MLQIINDFLYSYILIILLVLTGIYFTYKTKFVQFRFLKNGIKTITEKSDQNKVSSFQALMISTASRVGTGNIAGVANAIAIGGAGSVFWMWLIAVIGSATAFIESTLAQIYKEKDGTGYRGGPAYYMQKALHKRWLGIIFAILLIICFAFGFNGLQAFNIVDATSIYIKNEQMGIIIGIILVILTGLVIFGGIHRIGVISSYVVPIMAIIYIAIGILVILLNIEKIPQVIIDIFNQALNVRAFGGGVIGVAIMQGIKRGLFSNEAGMGSAPNAAAAAEVSHPVKQGLVQVISVFIDTLIICSTTAFILLLFGTQTEVQGIGYMQEALSSFFGPFGIAFITLAIYLFAFTSIIGNYSYAESNFKFITNNPKALFCFRMFCLLAVFIGAINNLELAWTIADISMGLMALVNIAVIIKLGNIAFITLKDYEQQVKEGKNPKFNPKKLGIKNVDEGIWEE